MQKKCACKRKTTKPSKPKPKVTHKPKKNKSPDLHAGRIVKSNY